MLLFRKSVLNELIEEQENYYKKTGQFATDVILTKRELINIIEETKPLYAWSRQQANYKGGFMVHGVVVHLNVKGNTCFSYDDIFN